MAARSLLERLRLVASVPLGSRTLAGETLLDTVAQSALAGLADEDSFEPVDGAVARDPLGFPGYDAQLRKARASAGVDESVLAGPATIGGHPVEIAAFQFAFLAGSMGEVAGERIARALERAATRQVPCVLRTATGGARMQEGMAALAQMPKLVAARIALADAAQPLIAVLAHPTTGGVLASIGALADVTVAEDGATIGFAGPRVAERVTGAPIGAMSHSAHAALNSGLVDMVESPERIKDYVSRLLSALAAPEPVEVDKPPTPVGSRPGDAWAAVGSARADERPRAPHLVPVLSEFSVQLRGDRAGAQDPAVIPFIARIAGRPAMVVGFDRHFSPAAGGFRKARRCIAIAGRLRVPIVTLIDTRGADPSPQSEAAGVAWEIGATFEAMLTAPVPVLAVVTGEGGSGGALALAVGDVVVAYEGSVFSVIAPELAAEILWRDTARAPEAARALRLTAHDLVALGIADELVAEPFSAESLRYVIAYHLGRLAGTGHAGERRAVSRRRRWRGPADGD